VAHSAKIVRERPVILGAPNLLIGRETVFEEASWGDLLGRIVGDPYDGVDAQQIELAPAQPQPNLCRDVNGNVRIEHPESVTANRPPAEYNTRDYEMVLLVCRARKDQCFSNTSGNDPQSWQANARFWKSEPVHCKQGTGIPCKWPPPAEVSAAFQPEKAEPATLCWQTKEAAKAKDKVE